MSDHENDFISSPLEIFQVANTRAQTQLRAEKIAAERQALLAEAYRQMPSDMRERSKEWGVSALMELVWLNGWDCGYRQSVRDRSDIDRGKE